MMKFRFLTLTFFCIIIVFAGASYGQEPATIRVAYSSAPPAGVQMIADRNYLGLDPVVMEVPFRSGMADVQFVPPGNEVVQLVCGNYRFPLYVEPGYRMTFSINESVNPPILMLDGKGSEENKMMQRFFQQFGSDFADTSMNSRMMTLSVDAFEMEVFNARKKHLDFVKSDEAAKMVSDKFRQFLNDQIEYRYWWMLLEYPIARANSDQKILSVSPLPDVMLENLSKVKVDNEPAMIAEAYREFLKYYVIYFTSKSNGFKKFTDTGISADRKSVTARGKLSDKIYTYWLARFLKEECTRIPPASIKKLKNELTLADKPGTSFTAINKICDEKDGMKPVDPKAAAAAPAAASPSGEPDLTDLNGKPVKMADFKGKVVYIDFWASWCGPCRGMMPFSKQMHDQLTDKQKKEIVFLYISIDANEESWRKGIKDMSIEGVNVISPGNWNSKACRYFGINSIPRYMIMNKKGEIIDNNAPRPNDPALLQRLIDMTKE